jgi:hypothetical protein
MAAEYQACFEIVRTLVKPEREKNARESRRERWWRFGETAPGLYRAISGLKRVIVMPVVSKVLLPVMCPADIVFSHSVVVIARSDYPTFGMLSSTIHRDWARRYSSTLESRPRYSPSDCFLTFPFPSDIQDLSPIGATLEKRRLSVMNSMNLGLTSVYNLIHDSNEHGSEVVELRSTHLNLDEAVCHAYGWTDVELNYGFHQTDEGIRWTICDAARDEILDRLLELNHQRHRQELAKGTVSDNGTPVNGKARRTKKTHAYVDEQQMVL